MLAQDCRLVHMCLQPGQRDEPHDHPKHYMYILAGGLLRITGAPMPAGETMETEMPTGAGMVMPPWVRIHNSRVYAWANLTVVHVPGVRLYRPVRMPTESGLESALRETMQVIGTQQQEEAQQVQEDQVANARGARRASTSKYRRPSTSTSVGNPPR